MTEWMNEWKNLSSGLIGWMNEWMNTWKNLSNGLIGWINEWIDELERKGWRWLLGVWKNAGSSVYNLLSILLLITTSI